MSEQDNTKKVCKRCGRNPELEPTPFGFITAIKDSILSNGLCRRCDDVLYGHHANKERESIVPLNIRGLERDPPLKHRLTYQEFNI